MWRAFVEAVQESKSVVPSLSVFVRFDNGEGKTLMKVYGLRDGDASAARLRELITAELARLELPEPPDPLALAKIELEALVGQEVTKVV